MKSERHLSVYNLYNTGISNYLQSSSAISPGAAHTQWQVTPEMISSEDSGQDSPAYFANNAKSGAKQPVVRDLLL